MDEGLNMRALAVHTRHCTGCEECRRPLPISQAREFVKALDSVDDQIAAAEHPDMEEARLREQYFGG